MTKLAFLGTGNMGAATAGRLIATGHEVCVYNRTPEKAAPLAERGATIAATPKDAAVGAEVVFAMVGDDEASKVVWLGETGALAASLADKAFIIECSTLSHDWVLELAEAAQGLGLRYIDCPVTGIPVAAAAGELTLLVGADEDVLAAAQPLLDVVSKDTIHFGGIGAGTADGRRADRRRRRRNADSRKGGAGCRGRSRRVKPGRCRQSSGHSNHETNGRGRSSGKCHLCRKITPERCPLRASPGR